MAEDIEERAAAPMGPTPWATVAERMHYYALGRATPICGDSIARDPGFAIEFPTLESYLEPPC